VSDFAPHHREDLLSTSKKIPRAILVSTYQGTTQIANCQEHLRELALLTSTYGVAAVQQIPCTMRKCDPATYIGKGKLTELVQIAQAEAADMIIFDDEITPAQQRNLQKVFQLPVLDRTEVILGVFAQRAQTKEAHLQIELAKVKYEAPRLKSMWNHLSRQSGTSGGGGGGAYLKGEGEKQIEIDRRILKRKIDQLQKEIEEVRKHRHIQRSNRQKTQIPVFAIVGYTNAGKSTLLNALTDAGVFVEDKLFATLDTITRKFTLNNHQDILLIDTVGFIRKLPHLLIAAFKSTLEESLAADILLHLIDVSHPMAEEQAKTTYEVLKELGAQQKNIITVFNKIDLPHDEAMLLRLRMSYPKNVQISAKTQAGFAELQEMMIYEISQQRHMIYLSIPQSDYAMVSAIIRSGEILKQEYEENNILLAVNIPLTLLYKLADYQIESF